MVGWIGAAGGVGVFGGDRTVGVASDAVAVVVGVVGGNDTVDIVGLAVAVVAAVGGAGVRASAVCRLVQTLSRKILGAN